MSRLSALARMATGCAAVMGLAAVCVPTIRAAEPGEAANTVRIDAGSLRLVHETDARFQSFQIGMSHLTGGETWRTYDRSKSEGEAKQAESFDAVREARTSTDLANRRLRNLTRGLAPLYIRYGGTTSNSVYFHDSDAPASDQPPEGFQTILTRERWRAALDFAKAVDARIVTGFTVSEGVRDASGAWTAAHADPWIKFTRAAGGRIYAAELYNEPNAREPGRTEAPETPENYARDFARLAAFRARVAPDLKLAGPGTAMLGLPIPIPSLEGVSAEQYLSANPRPAVDIVSYHFYGALAERCAPPTSPAGVGADDALTEQWLERPDKEFQKFKTLRDTYAPGAPIWLTETGAAACGGTRWQPTFLDAFRFLDTQARLAHQGLDVIITHALISGSNGIIDEKTFQPNADYWAALLWRRLIGTKVLEANATQTGLHIYAHCQRGQPGGVTILAINLRTGPASLIVSSAAEIYALSAPELQSSSVHLNGEPLQLGADDTIPRIKPVQSASGAVTIAPTSIAFITVPSARNTFCRR